jgi:Ni,Fe-hydrogenase III large subunit
MARFCVRVDEMRVSLSLLTDFTQRSDALDVVTWIEDRSGGQALEGGVGIAEGWRGAVVHRVELDGEGRLVRVKVVDPSFLNWPALPVCLTDTIVPDFPLANKSFNLSYAGNDL